MKYPRLTELLIIILSAIFAGLLTVHLIAKMPHYSQWQTCELEASTVATNSEDGKDWFVSYPMYLQMRTNMTTGEIQFRSIDYKSSQWHKDFVLTETNWITVTVTNFVVERDRSAEDDEFKTGALIGMKWFMDDAMGEHGTPVPLLQCYTNLLKAEHITP